MITGLISVILVFAGLCVYFVAKAGGSVKLSGSIKVKWGSKL